MPLMPTRNKASREFLRRTNTRLIVAEGAIIGGQEFEVDPKLPVQFNDIFGGEAYLANRGAVLVGKGRVVSPIASAIIAGKQGRPKLTLCNNGTADASYTGQPACYPIGIAPYHYYQDVPGQFGGGVVGFLSKALIEVPCVDNDISAANIKTGVAYGTLTEGDYVKSDTLGRLIKADPTVDNPISLVGRVVNMIKSVPPLGWLEWVMLERNILQAEGVTDLNYPTLERTAYNPAIEGKPYPYDPTYAWPLYKDARGIEFLTDGGYFGNIQYTDEKCLNVNGTEYVNPDPVPAVGTVVRLYVQNAPISTKDANGNTRDPIITIRVGATNITADCTVDYLTGEILWTVAAGRQGAVGNNVTATYFRGPGIPGIPRNWDEANALGAVRVLMII